LIVFINYLRC